MRRPLLALALLLSPGCREAGGAGPTSLLGERAPAFALQTLSHDRFYIDRQAGRTVLLAFWSTTCLVCKKELLELESLRLRLGSNRLVMAGVCTDPENIDEARRLIRQLEIGYATLLDRGGNVSRSYRVRTWPTTVLITPRGRIGLVREGLSGPLIRQIQRQVESLLGG